jgi:hypothetical protein
MADGHRFTERFLVGEWRDAVDAWQLTSWDAYPRCRLPRPQDPDWR